jgi:hypothetical protein
MIVSLRVAAIGGLIAVASTPGMAQTTGTFSSNHHPTGRSSSAAAADRKPVLVQLGDGLPTCRTAKSKGCPMVVQQSDEPSLGRALRKP